MTDTGDEAQALDEFFRETALRRRIPEPLDRREQLGQAAGHCLSCGDEIPSERLRANPAALRCIDCQAETERRRV